MRDLAKAFKRIECGSFAEFARAIQLHTAGWESVWYRGSPGEFALQPKIFRNVSVKSGFRTTFDELNEVYLNESIDRKLSFFSQEAITYLDVLCLAQHLKFPTRLLDWSENLATALYFALESPKADPHIWILNPLRLNAVFHYFEEAGTRLAYKDFDEETLEVATENAITGIFRTIQINDGHDNPIDKYASMSQGAYFEERCYGWPIAFYPKYVNRRLLTQQAGFTIHGMSKEPLEKLLLKLPRETRDTILIGLKFIKEFAGESLHTLRSMCPSPVQIFNDEEGLFQDILENDLWHMDE